LVIVYQLLHDTLDAIALLHKSDRITQALILLYSAIDTLAWLGTPGDTTRTAFREWVDQYVLSGSSLACTSEDLYSARCGLLHTHTAESSSMARRNARQIWYWTGEKSRQLLEHEVGNRTDVVLVRVSDLVAAVAKGGERFVGDLAQDPARAALAQQKARLWLAWVPAPPAA
jgi:hypothetical protein